MANRWTRAVIQDRYQIQDAGDAQRTGGDIIQFLLPFVFVFSLNTDPTMGGQVLLFLSFTYSLGFWH